MTMYPAAAEKLSNEAREYFHRHLKREPVTEQMLERLHPVIAELEAAGLEEVVVAAMFRRALKLEGVKKAADLPFPLERSVSEILDGSRTREAMRRFAKSPEARQGAALLNTVYRIAREKLGYRWAARELQRSSLEGALCLSFQIRDPGLSRVPGDLMGTLGGECWLDTFQKQESKEVHQLVRVARVAVFWIEEGVIHCGLGARDSEGWLENARFALRRGYPVHRGFLGKTMAQKELADMIFYLEARQ